MKRREFSIFIALPVAYTCTYVVFYFLDFCNRFLYLLSFQFSEFSVALALSLLQYEGLESCDLSHDQLMNYFNNYDLKRLELYSRNMADYHLVTDLIPKCRTPPLFIYLFIYLFVYLFIYLFIYLFVCLFLVSLLYFTNKLSFSLSLVQKVFQVIYYY